MPISKELVKQLNEPNYYARLGLESNAEDSEIKKAYKKISLQVHPDKNNGERSLFQKLWEAYETLQDAQKRAEYDSKQSLTANPPPIYQDTSLTASKLIKEDVVTLEKINNFISKIEREISNIPYLGATEPNQQFSKIKLKQDKFYLLNQIKFSALNKAVRKFLFGVKSDVELFLIKNKIQLEDPSFLDMNIETETLEVFYQKIISASEDIKKQIRDAFELLKSKTTDPHLIALYDQCINSNTNTSISKNFTILSTLLQQKYNSLQQDKNFTPGFKRKIEQIYTNLELSSIEKIKLFFTEIDNFENEKILKTKVSSLLSNRMYSDEFISTIKFINLQQTTPSEKILKISELELNYQKKYILENNVNAIYQLLKKKFPAFVESAYQVSESENDDDFSRTFRKVQKLESFFLEICKDYQLNSPYKENRNFLKNLSSLQSEQKTITEKFDGLSRLVGAFEDEYLMEKIKPLNDACWALFEKELERPRDLTMANFEKFNNEQTNKFRQQLKEFASKITSNKSFEKENRDQIVSFCEDLPDSFWHGMSLETLFQLINKYSNLKDKFDLHINSEQQKKSAVETSSTPTSSNTPNQVHEKSTTEQRNNDPTNKIKEKLSKYRERIEKNKNAKEETDYAHGFWVLKKSRAISRKINYLLAIKLLDHLNTKPGDFFTYEKVMELRQGIVDKLTQEDKKHYAERGINSTELNEIINAFKPKK